MLYLGQEIHLNNIQACVALKSKNLIPPINAIFLGGHIALLFQITQPKLMAQKH